MLFSAAFGWLRQYLVIHTGNRTGAVLGSRVLRHLMRLPLPYFQHRPTGVLVARLRGVETIREFLAGSLATVLPDLPFMGALLAVMFVYGTAYGCRQCGRPGFVTGGRTRLGTPMRTSCHLAVNRPMWVAPQMGHADWTVIARGYGRWIPEAAPDAGQKAAAIFGSNAGKIAGIAKQNVARLTPTLEN